MYSTNNMGLKYKTFSLSRFFTVLIVLLASLNSNAQITVNQANSSTEVENLVEDVLLGACVTASNVSYTGPASASGTFDASGTTFTMQNGILLTTGGANIAIGPNNLPNAQVNQNRSGDPDLTSLAGETTFDAVVLEFDFVPQDDTLTFRYVFASEEYPEWVGSEYNDVFGFFVAGPGIAGPFTSPTGFPNGSTNIALIPGTTTPVAINNVNNGDDNNGPCDNCAYYVENGNDDVQYDGYTTVLTAQVVVTPCETYHIRLAVADAGDQIYDSGVFLEAGSFTSGGGITVDFTNVAIEEGCSDEYIVFRRVDLSDNSTALGATYTISGTATSGIDYNTFPTSVSIPAGQDSVVIPIVVPLDYTVEGVETIVVNMDQPPCDCLAPGSATINVIDNDVPLALTTTGETTICLGQSANLTASVSGSLPPYSGSWNNGAPAGGNVTVSPTNTTTYTYTVTDACNSQTETSTETVTVIRPDFNTNDQSQCLDGNSFSFTNTGASGGTVTHFWDFGDGNSSTSENPTHSYLADGDFTVTHYVIFTATNCTASASALMTVYPEPTVTVSVDADVICSGGTDGALLASASGGTAGYNYSWSPSGATSFSISGVGVGTYTVTVTDSNGCTDSDAGNVVQNDPVPPTITCPATASITTDADECTSSASIGTPTSDDNCGVASVVVDNAGPYAVGTTTVTWTVTDVNGNTNTCTQDVVVTDDEDPTILVCPSDINVTPSSSDCTPEVTWNIPQADDNCSATLSSTHNSGDSFTVGTTTVTYTATDLSGNTFDCSFDVTITPLVLVLSIDPSTVICGANISCNGATDGTATANVSGGCLPYTYLWSNGQTTETATGLGAGTYTVTVTDANGSTESESIALTEPETLEIDTYEISEYVGGAGVSCNGAADGEIDIFIEGGATCEPYDIAWTGPNGYTSSSQNLTGLEAGSYTVTITDINGCSTSATYTISEPAGLDPNCTSEDALCNGDANGSVEVSVTGGTAPYSYSWSNGSSDGSQSGLTAGTYAVTITDANGCTVSCNSVVNEPDVLTAVVTAFDETLVNGCNGSAIATPTGGTTPYSYDWSDGQSNSTATDLCADTYTVTVTDANGCTFTTSVVINPPTCDLDVDVTATDVSCNGGTDGTATATPLTNQNNTPFTYSWNNGATTQTLSGVTAGPYAVVVTDSIGCEASGSVVISEPTELSVSTTVVDEQTFGGCDGSATATPSGGTPPYSYEWNDSDSQTTQTASDLCPGTYTVTVTDANGCEETVTITVNPLLCTGFSVAINTEGLSCFEAGDGSATAVVTGGTAPFSYSWSNGGSTSTISGLDAGTYTVTVTDAVNCSQTVSGNVSQPALLEAATAVDNVSCHGLGNGVVELTVTGGTPEYTFAWDNGATTEDLNGVGPGSYNVLVTDENGCTTTASAIVTQHDTLGASSIDIQVSCNEETNGSIDLEPTGGLAPYLYDWSNGATTQDISGLSAGTYSVTFADQNGCLFTYETTISEPDLLVPTCTSEDALCNGDANGSVSVSVAGGTAPFSYAWSNGSTDALQSGLSAGTYVVTVTDANGCTATCNVTVGEPNILTAVVDVQDETLVNGCNGSATANPTGGTPPYSYEWSNGETTQTITDLCAGTYTVIVTDANECEFTTSNIVNPPSCDLDVDMSSTDVNCNDGEDGTATATPITVQNNTPFTYAWNNSGTTQTINGISAGPYSVVVTDSIGCEASGSVVISEPTALSVSTTVVDEQNFGACDGSATATASGGTPPYSYEWSDGQTTATASNLCPGTYTVTVTDANGCEETVIITVNPLLCTGFSVAINTESLSCFEAGDGSATAVVTGGTAPFTYSWDNGGTTSSISGLEAGQYTVTVTDAVNCSQTVSGNVSQPALLEAATAVDNVSCHGVGNGVIELTVTGGTAPYDFDWDNGAITEDLNNVGPGSYNVLITDENGCTVSASATVTEPDTMQVSSVDVNPTCFEGNDGSIDLTISGGLGPYLVAWDSGQNTADISGLTAGTYVATIVDQNGCIYTYSTTLTDPQLVVPTITADGPTIFCEGDSVTLTASEASSYVWLPNGETTQSITVYDADDYSVSVVTADGCEGTSASTTVSIFQVDPATITPSGPTEFCDGSSVVLTASSGSSYLWMPNGETTQSITVTNPGNYSVTITDQNGCESSSADIEITVFDLPVPIVTPDGPLTFCDGGSVTLTSSEAAAYSWAPFGQTTQSIVVTESGIYRVTITNEDGCQSTSDPIQVIVNDNPEPVITANGPTEFCEGGEVDLSGPAGFVYNWSPNGENTQMITATASGDYQLTVTDENGCSGESNIITVTEFDVDTATVTAQGNTEFCEGGEVILVSSPGASYEWSPNGETTQSINVTESGFYSVTVVDQNGCETTSDAVEVIVNPLPDATVTASGPLQFCEGDSVVLSAPNGLAYNWTPNGETTQSITVYTTGTFSVFVTDQNQCSNESTPVSTTMFEQDDVEVLANGPTEFCDGDQVVLTASTGDAFVWSPNGETTQSITVTQSGVYTVSITDANGCSYASEDSVEVTVNPNPVPTVTPDGPTEFCDEESVTLTSSVAESYAWAPNGETTQSIVVTESGTYRVTVTDENGCQGTSAPVVVTVFDLPDPTITTNGPLTICPEDSVTLTSSAASSYEWSPNGETSQSITISDPGTFSVLVVDQNGCEGESESVVVEDFEVEPVTVIADGITEFCDGDSVTLTASSGDAFVWSPNGETTASIVVTESGDYSVFVTDANGCSTDADTITVTVNELPEPVITLSGPSSFCEGDSITLTVTAGEAYLWEPNGETTQSITVYESGSYSVQIADANTCVGMSDTVDVEVFEVEEVEIGTSGPIAFCDGGEVELSAIGGTSWTWAPNGESTQAITVTTSGEYSVEILDANGCSNASDTITVEVYELPTVSVSASSMEICEGDSAMLTASTTNEVTFEWFENGSTVGGATDSTLYVLDESTYSVLVTDTNGCTATDDAPVIAVGPVPVAVITGGSIACPGETLVLVASGGESYLWSNGETSESISVLADSVGTYTVTVSNEFCNQTSSASADVDVFDTPDALIQTNPSGFLEVEHLFDEVSGDSSIVFWTWDFGDGILEEGQAVNNYYSDEGFFTVVVTTENENGCLGSDTAVVEITQVIDIPNVFTPNDDGYNDHLFIGNFGVDNYEMTIYNRWGIVMHHDDTGEIFWDGKTPAGVDAEAGSYFYILDVINPDHSEGSFKKTGYITLIR